MARVGRGKMIVNLGECRPHSGDALSGFGEPRFDHKGIRLWSLSAIAAHSRFSLPFRSRVLLATWEPHPPVVRCFLFQAGASQI
jgi:hypothetical protein